MNKQESVKPRVLFIIHLPPPIHGSSMVGSYIKSSNAINDEFDATYINLTTNTTLSKSGKMSIKKLFIFLSLLKTVAKTVFNNKFDTCYVSLTTRGFGFYKDLIIVTLLKLTSNNIVYHFHNKGVSVANSSRINRAAYRYAFKNTKSILLSPLLYHDIKMHVKKKDVFYCPNGIPPITSFIKEKVAADRSAKCRLLYLSNMMSDKGAYVLLDAVKKLQNKGLSFECNYVGAWSDITEETFKHQIKENGLEDVVFAHGPKYGADKESFFNEADIFLFPTYYHYEAFPMVNLEAMQYSLPIVSTPEGGIPDAVIHGENGLLAPQKDSSGLAGMLERLINDPELRISMGKAGKELFDKHFTFSKFEDRFISIIKEVSVKNIPLEELFEQEEEIAFMDTPGGVLTLD